MSGRYLLDTNAIIALFAADTSMIQHMQKAEEVFIPSIAVGELYYGAHRSHRRDANLANIEDFVSTNVVLSCSAETARHYGKIKDSLRRQGRPIPENDLWIAALAVQHGLTLVIHDAHFAEVPDLVRELW